MAEYSGHFDKGSSEPTYSGAEFAQFVEVVRLSGVAYNYLNVMAVSATGAGLSVYVATGAALAGGYYYITTAQLTKSIDAQGAGTDRIDRIVVRATAASKTVEVAVLKGTAAASPSAPALTQTAAVYEISLAQVYVTGGAVTITAGNITDERSYIERASGVPIADAGSLITATNVEAALQELATNIATKLASSGFTAVAIKALLDAVNAYAAYSHQHTSLDALAIVNDLATKTLGVVNVYLLPDGDAEPTASNTPRGSVLLTYTP